LNYPLFNSIEKLILKNIDIDEIFTVDYVFIKEFTLFNKNLLEANNIKSCYKVYTAQTLTN
jgi:hypothetical protein